MCLKKFVLKKGLTLWLTGLSGSGKSTITQALAKKLSDSNPEIKLEILDGDEIREHLCKDLGFSKEDRLKNIERIAFLAGKISKHGVLVLVPVIAPYQSARKQARELSKNFVEVFISASLETVKSRDPKGLYKKALSGEIKNFTGVSDPYEIPENPDIHIETEKLTVEESCNKIISYLEKHGYLDCLNPVENL
jgi:adenylyl-sulfate kinase